MDDILDRWCLIANYLRVSEKTAIRYSQKKERPLPVKYDPAGHPTITKTEIDGWKRSA